MSAAAILAVLLAHPSWFDRDLSAETREATLRPVAVAIAEATHTPLEAAELIALGRHESNFVVAVMYGGCELMPKGSCDNGKARGAWQLHREACPAAYTFAPGSVESLEAEARCAIGQLRHHAWRCREHAATPLHGAFSGYATGGDCHWRGAEARVQSTRRTVAELERAEGAVE